MKINCILVHYTKTHSFLCACVKKDLSYNLYEAVFASKRNLWLPWQMFRNLPKHVLVQDKLCYVLMAAVLFFSAVDFHLEILLHSLSFSNLTSYIHFSICRNIFLCSRYGLGILIINFLTSLCLLCLWWMWCTYNTLWIAYLFILFSCNFWLLAKFHLNTV